MVSVKRLVAVLVGVICLFIGFNLLNCATSQVPVMPFHASAADAAGPAAPVITQLPAPEPEPKMECKKHPCIQLGGLLGPITEKNAAEAVAFIQEAGRIESDAIVILVASPGGDFDASEEIYDAIWASTVPVYCYVKGMAMSGAFWLIQACKERAAEHNARLMVHAPYLISRSGSPMHRRDLVAAIAQIDMTQSIMTVGIAERMQMTKAELDKRLDEGDWLMSASQAKDNKAIDVVIPRDVGLEGYIRQIAARHRTK